MKRRTLIGSLAATGIAPHAAIAQQAKPVIAYLSARSPATDNHLLAAFRDGLKEAGYVDGQNVTIDVHWANSRYERLPAMAKDLAAAKPAVLVAVGANQAGLAAKAATSTIPVVFGVGADPVDLGLVRDLARPEANLTGTTLLTQLLDAKRVELLREMAPGARSVVMLFNPSNPGAAGQLKGSQAAANALGLHMRVLEAQTEAEIDRAFDSLDSAPVDLFAVAVDSFLIGQRTRIVVATAARKLPAMFPSREFVDAGGLASYAPRWVDMYRIIGTYAGRLLKGAKPGDLPIQRPTTFELVVNLRTAKALGLTLSPAFLNRADETID
jgi:putative tryptophan/tyrosine transport system substrate-binding protein